MEKGERLGRYLNLESVSLRVRLDHRVWGKCRKGKNLGNFHSFDLGAWGMSIIVEKVDYCADEVLISSLAS